MIPKIILIFVLTYAASSTAMRTRQIVPIDALKKLDIKTSINSIGTATGGIIGAVPELVTDTFGNILDINNMPNVPWIPVPELIINEGYPSESHFVTTSDGYVLNIHRIPYGKSGASNGQVVYLQHGLFAASSDWVLNGPKNALGYILADLGYDVWMGNVRGNRYSRNHTTFSPSSKEFWQFDWHEIGKIDIPTIIDYILEQTQQSDLFHIGHSQGTTSFYVMTSLKPEYNNKIKAHISLAPIAYMNHLFSPLLRIVSLGTLPLDVLFQMVGQYEFMPSSGFLNFLTDAVCSEGVGKVLCKNVLFAMAGFSPKQMNVSSIPLLMAHYSAGAATKQVVHYGQEVNSGKFEQFDYGAYRNYKIYGSIFPPDYDLSKITAPMYLIYSSNDWLAANVDVEKLYSQLPNGKELYNIPIQTWNHLDFLFGNNATEMVYDKIVQILSNY
ncbi:unnamed protein product [Psylliodes chrysocephalus]|uniref:Partial AB-hydrolase lipase domain-containing protein n=1 Tax=Psylliodes chrysocephalus TaxID=3402493 RepID=A0A9P0CV77_9CUCU|nr:unnamed protein product [Psylliodes chrysocephala]